jgi:hypothetical protein
MASQARCQLQIIERSRGYLVYKEIGEDVVRLVTKYGEETYSMTVIEMRGNVLRAFKKWDNPEEVEDLVVAVKLKPRTAAKLREYMYRINTAIETAVFWFELERAIVYMTPKGADIKFWKLNLDEPEKRQKPIMRILSRLKPRLFS